jgi:cytosine/uracil/thiamine/allantoin permease
MKTYFIYHLRWQASAWVMMPVMYRLEHLEMWQGFCISQFFGALVFWFIDKIIFKYKG